MGIEWDNSGKKLNIGSGTIQHTQAPYINYVNGGYWSVGSVSLTLDEIKQPLDSNKAYYLYAKVENTDGVAAEMVLNEEQRSNVIDNPEPNTNTDEAYLLMGILSSEFEGQRVFNRTNGFSSITGGTITTEQIQDAGRNLIIDFQSNPPRIIARNKAEIVGNIKFLSADGNTQTLNEAIGVIGGRNLLENTSFHYDYKIGEKVAFTRLYTLNAGQKYIATYGKFEDNAGVANEWARGVCLVVSQSPSTESIELVVEFGKPFEVNGNGRHLYIAWGVYEYVNSVKGSTSNEYVINNFIQYLDQVMLQEGEIATEFQEPIAKYDYLTRVLKDGSTDIEGGLVMTNVLALKDIQVNPDGTTTEQVTAGMSGVKDDNVLMWGGGTYEEAVNASSGIYGEYNKSDGKPITSLLKKDGKGKIGIFKIDDTHAVVTVPEQGSILIDASTENGGIYLADKDQYIRTAISNRSIDDSEKNIKVGTQSTKHAIIPLAYDSDIEEFSSGIKALFETPFVKSCRMEFDLSVKVDTAKAWNSSNVSIYCNLNTSNHGTIPIINTNVSFTRDNVTDNIARIHCVLDSNDINSQDTTVGVYMYIGVNPYVLHEDYFAEITNFQMDMDSSIIMTDGTIIGNDGVLCKKGEKMFKVQYTPDDLKIYAKGLSDGSDRTAGSGELYVTSSFVDAFVNFLDEFYLYVNHVRTIGSNAGNADDMQDKIKKIKNTLIDASGNRITDIIASS
jgi:hypothetical protein